MPLPYQPWTEDEVKARNVVPEGDYKFEILTAIEKRTKPKLDDRGQQTATYPMIELDFIFTDQNGVSKTLKDWIVFMPGMDWKLRHLAKSIGLLSLYEDKKLEAVHLAGRKGMFTLGIKDNVYNGEQRRQNFVKDYVGEGQLLAVTGALPAKEEFDNDLPF